MRLQPTHTIKALFPVLMGLLPLQYYFAKTYAEPYPALLMPAFEGSMADENGTITTHSVDVFIHFDDGTKRRISSGTLLADAPSSHRGAIIKAIFRSHNRTNELPDNIWGSVPWKQLIKRHVIPGYVLRMIRMIYLQEAEPQTCTWLRQRIRALYPDRKPVSALFLWYKDSYTVSHARPRRNRKSYGVFEVGLRDVP